MEFSKRSLIMTIKIVCGAPYNVMGGKCAVVMVPFGGKAFGPYFSGDIIGTGVDSQRITRGGAQLSARYMLEGEDCEGEKCRIFIENSGTAADNCMPFIVTDSRTLAFLEQVPLRSMIETTDNGLTVIIYRTDVQ